MSTAAAMSTASRTTPLDLVVQPTPLELLQLYLLPHISNPEHPIPSFIHVVDVYSFTPDVLTARYPSASARDESVAWYFFTPIKPKKGGRKEREVVRGCSWHQERRSTDLPGSSSGYVTSLTFLCAGGEGQGKIRSGWLMKEIGSRGDAAARQTVLCVVYRTPRPRIPTAPPTVESTHGSGGRALAPGASTYPPVGSGSPATYPPVDSGSLAATASPSTEHLSPVSSGSMGGSALIVEVCQPGDVELVERHLIPQQKTMLKIHHSNVYNFEPAELSRQFETTLASDGQKVWYFFSDQWIGIGARKVGTSIGFWESQFKMTAVVNANKKIGDQQLFRFFKADDPSQDPAEFFPTGWYMVEYSSGNQDSGMVLLKMYETTQSVGPVSKRPFSGCTLGGRMKKVKATAATAAI